MCRHSNNKKAVPQIKLCCTIWSEKGGIINGFVQLSTEVVSLGA